jgi:hypothetical protein
MRTLQIRLLDSLYKKILDDLDRPHPFAAERIGFVFTRQDQAARHTTLILPVDYSSVQDELYDENEVRYGATISSTAIRQVMQRLLNSGEGAFHVHSHAHSGRPRFSQIDLKDIPKIARSFHNINPSVRHGALLFSENNGVGRVVGQEIDSDPTHPAFTEQVSITIVGSPLRFFIPYQGKAERLVSSNYDR